MKFLVTKANHDYWHKVETYNSLEELIASLKRRHTRYSIARNIFYQGCAERIKEFYSDSPNFKVTLEEAKEMTTIEYEIEILNSYA